MNVGTRRRKIDGPSERLIILYLLFINFPLWFMAVLPAHYHTSFFARHSSTRMVLLLLLPGDDNNKLPPELQFVRDQLPGEGRGKKFVCDTKQDTDTRRTHRPSSV